eukprot:2135185-Rhodomonas_salina.3
MANTDIDLHWPPVLKFTSADHAESGTDIDYAVRMPSHYAISGTEISFETLVLPFFCNLWAYIALECNHCVSGVDFGRVQYAFLQLVSDVRDCSDAVIRYSNFAGITIVRPISPV